MIPDYLAPWKEVLGGEWPEAAGVMPTREELELALTLGAPAGTKYGLAWAMFCRSGGATRDEIESACGGSQFNMAKALRDRGAADFMKVRRPDAKYTFFLGRHGSKPGGQGATPVGRDDSDDDQTQADRIRAFVMERYINPARERGDVRVSVRAGDVHKEMGLQNALPAVCSAVGSAIFKREAKAELVERSGPANSTTSSFTFEFVGGGRGITSSAEALLRERYGTPLRESQYIASFAGPDGRQLALERGTASLTIWLEDENRGPPPVGTIRSYAANQGRQSNLPPRLSHQPDKRHSGLGFPKPVYLVRLQNLSEFSALLDWYDRGQSTLNREALERLRVIFLERYPDFPISGFAADEKGSFEEEDGYKRRLIAEVRSLLENSSTQGDEALGAGIYAAMTGKGVNLLDFRVVIHFNEVRARHPGLLEKAIGQLATDDRDVEEATSAFLEAVWGVLAEGQTRSQPYTQTRMLPTLVLALVRPHQAIAIRTQPFTNAGRMLLGTPIFANGPLSREEHSAALSMSRAIFDIMRDEWHWAPRDLWDVQSFIWITCQDVAHPTTNEIQPTERPQVHSPTNLILYGPPGTGKTYATAAKAILLCGVRVPEDREELMEVYRGLVDAGRIEFVTFHQSMSYEDFIEGRQPMTDSEAGEGSASPGFRLETVHGIFRRIAKRAQISRGPSSGSGAVALNHQQVFKMSIGRANVGEDARFFEEAIEGGYTLLGWENIDWSDQKYAEASAILERCQQQATNPNEVNAQSGQVQHTDVFRNRMKIGDIIIVSKGNSFFRAIGIVTGDYEYSPRPEGVMCHRRPVKWLWFDSEGVPAKDIYESNFIQATIYRLRREGLNVAALERYMNSGLSEVPAVPEPFVLIIDEINRANISKVLGELITLLEADKRLGQPNALKLRLPYSGDDFGVPSNLHILGTMNTADRSIALLDTALRRRFAFQEVMPDPSVLEEAAEACGIRLPLLLATINDRIEYLYDREHQIGHAYFTACRSVEDVDEVMRHKVIPLLAEYFFEDWAKIAAVLGDLEPHDGAISGGFLKRSLLSAPPGLADDEAVPRYRWQVRSKAEGFDYAKLARS